MKHLIEALAVATGGAVGALLRWGVGLTCGQIWPQFPVGTLVINLTGSFFLGWFVTAIGNRLIVSDVVRLGIAVGFVGAYTTFSTFMLESNALWDDGAFFKAVTNVAGSIVLGLIAVRLGTYVGGR